MIVEDIIVIDDEGCEVWPTCTECPLSRCRFDDPRWFAAGINRARDLRVVEAIERGRLSLSEAARRFHVRKRTIHRKLARARGRRDDLDDADAAVFARLATCIDDTWTEGHLEAA